MKTSLILTVAVCMAVLLVSARANPVAVEEVEVHEISPVQGMEEVAEVLEPLLRQKRRVHCTYYPGKKQPVCYTTKN